MECKKYVWCGIPNVSFVGTIRTSDFVGVQWIRWEGNGTEPAEYTFLYGIGNENHELGAGLLNTKE
jgi:hypothetical protein